MIRPRLLIAMALAASSLPAAGLAQAPLPVPEGPAPAPHCLDAGNVQHVKQAEAGSIAVRAGDGQAYRLDFAAACPGVPNGREIGLETPEGWACGRPGERLLVDGRACGISAVDRIDNRAFARIARESNRQYPTTLPAVTVTGKANNDDRGRRLRGSPDFCFATRDVRGWNEDPKGIMVETNPRRNGGNRFYRIEVAGSCSNFASVKTVEFVSGLQNGLVCGNPGDRMVGVAFSPRTMMDTHIPGSQCTVVEVYPSN